MNRELKEWPMRRSEKEVKDRAWMESILRKALVCRIALCADHEPYLVPMNFGYRDGCLYLHSAPAGRKIDLLRQNNRVCFEVETDCELAPSSKACKWGVKYRSVIGFGRASLVEGPKEKAEALGILVEHYAPGKFQFPPRAVAKIMVIKIEIESMTGKKSGYAD
jgi:hypothetical protein